MTAAKRQYNVSGTVRCGKQLDYGGEVRRMQIDTWRRVLVAVLETEDVRESGHIDGAMTIVVSTPRVEFVSTGEDTHEFFALVHGGADAQEEFAERLESTLMAAGLLHSIRLHDAVQVLI